MSKPTLIIRADASASMGAGHILRALAIAQEWRDTKGAVNFACAEIPPPIRRRLNSEGMSTAHISATSGSLDDASELVKLASDCRAAAIVLDGYQFGSDYQAAIRRFDGMTLAVDDNAHLPSYPTDLVLNQNLGAASEWYAAKTVSGELLLGTRYALIRKEFTLDKCRKDFESSSVRRVLITLGGSDPTNATGIVIAGLRQVSQADLQFRVIVGHLNEHRQQLHTQIGTDPRFELLYGVDDMAAQYRWADFAIVAGGSTNWELCYYGIPRIILVIADNQRDIARELQQSEVAFSFDGSRQLCAAQLEEVFERFTNDPERLRVARRRAIGMVDGLGACRVISKLLPSSESVAAGPVGSG